MILHKVDIQGFMPFKERMVVEFSDEQIIAIVGRYSNDPERSNRAGKSACIEAIRWALFGRSRGKSDVELIHTGADHVQVVVQLKDERAKKSYSVKRWRDAKGNGGLELSGLEGGKKATTQTAINDLLGLDAREFDLTAFFPQNEIGQFFEVDAAERKRILLRWMQVTDWSVPEAAAFEMRQMFEAREAELRGQLEALSEPLSAEALRAEQETLILRREDLMVNLDTSTKKKAKLGIQLREHERVDEFRREVEKLGARVRELKSKRPDVDSSKKRKQELEGLLDNWEMVTPQTKEKAREVVAESQKKLGEIKHAREILAEKVRDARQNKTGICPILQEACARIELTPAYEQELRSQWADNKEQERVHEARLSKAEKLITLSQEQRTWGDELERIKLREQQAGEYEKQIAQATAQYVAALKKIPEDWQTTHDKFVQAIDAVDRTIRATGAEVMTVDRELGSVAARVKMAETAQLRRQALDVDLTEIRARISDLRWVEYMFGQNGIPSIELENSFSEIESTVNVVLNRLNAPFEMEFISERELREWEPECVACAKAFEKGQTVCSGCGETRRKKRRDELQVRIHEGGAERNFHLDSGGGKVLLAVAFRVALTLLARERSGSEWNVLFLDEIFGALDIVNREAMAELLVSTLQKEFGFKQILIISHNPDIQTATADVLEVRRAQDGTSELRWC